MRKFTCTLIFLSFHYELELWVLGRKATEIVDHFHHVLSKCHMLMSSLQSRSCEAPASPEGSLAASPAELSLQRQLKCTQKPPLAILHVDQSLELQCPGQEINEISPGRDRLSQACRGGL
ncbi:uncharacterized protein [Chlorocebus sabaeus]|uniref:uncharacterized protein isoform X4 n=1 Tax=Chlorocebus sabaeus TaxID=60711 RepID=UPI003BF9A4E2